MRNIVFWVLLLAAFLGLSSCDRFEHTFQPVTVINFANELFTPLQNGFNEATSTDLTPAMAYYADDYLHFGVNKADWEAALQNMLSGVANPSFNVTYTTTSLLDETNALANWRLVISNPDTKAVIADSSFIGERLVKRSGKWLLKGNQMTCEPPVGKQRVIVEYVTNVGCTYCPAVEAELHALSLLNPDKFIYLTHQLSGPVAINDPLYAYYNAFSAPTSIIQGQHKLASGTTDIIEQYAPLVNAQLALDTQMEYSVNSAVVSGSNLSGSVQLNPQITGFDQTNLVLNLALIEKVSSATSGSGEFLTNVVLARNRIDISALNWSNPVAFDFSANVAIPTDAALVVFVQRTPATFANNAVIYSGLEVPLSRHKGHK